VNEDYQSEEDVKVKFLLPYLAERGYELECCDFEKTIEVQEGTRRKSIFADVVVYSTPQKTTPLLCCETKGPDEVLDRIAREQAISYARLLPKIAPLALLTNGHQVQVFHALDKMRIETLPHRDSLADDFLTAVLSAQVREELRTEAKHELFIVDDVQTFKRLLKSCHDEIRNNEGYDPAEAFDELSKVLFCKMYEEKHGGTNRFKLLVFDQTLESLGMNIVQQIFKETCEDFRYQGLFVPGQKINLQDRTIRKIVQLFESTDLSLTAFDVKGEAFEYFLGDTFTGGLGQYFTPRNVVQFITDAVDLKIGEKIVDPFCGTGGFLIHAFEVVSEKIRFQDFAESEKEKWRLALSNETLYGTDWAQRTSQTCKMNMVVHGDGSAGIIKHHGLTDVPNIIKEGSFKVCLTNPPFGSLENDPEILKKYELGKGRKSQDRVILAVERALRLVEPGGRIGMVVIDGILNNASMKYVRDYIRRHAWIRGVVSLSPETFEGYGGRSATSVLLLERKAKPKDESQSSIFMAIARNTGYAPNGDPMPGNELPDILLDYLAHKNGKPLSGLSHSWIADLNERLDAAYYEPHDSAPDIDGATSHAIQTVAEFEEALATALQVREAIPNLLSDIEFDSIRLGNILIEVSERATVENSEIYRMLGVRWHGEGTFIREERLGQEIKDQSLRKVARDRLVYNRLFAFKGSFAMVAEAHHGACASNEFPMFIAKSDPGEPGQILLRYLVHFMNSPRSLLIVDAASSGSTKTSRNRFMQAMFLRMTVDVPKVGADMARIVNVMDAALDASKRARAVAEDARRLHEYVGSLLPVVQR